MNILIFSLGLSLVAVSGAIDRNPTSLRFATVLLLYSIGLELMINSVGGMLK